MKKESTLEKFWSDSTASLTLPDDVPKLPEWFCFLLQKKGCSSLQITRNGDDVMVEGKAMPFNCEFIKENEGRYLEIKYHGKIEMFPIDLEFPPALQMIQDGLEKLEMGASLVFFPDGGNCLEICSVAWPEPVELIRGILTMDSVQLRLVKSELICRTILRGAFHINQTALIAQVELGFAEIITAKIRAAEGTFPGLMDFIGWAAEGTGLEAEMAWLTGIAGSFDVAITGARVDIDGDSGRISGFFADARLTLWGMELDTQFLWPEKQIRGTLRQEKEISLGEMLKQFGAPGMDSALEALKLTYCSVNVAIAKEEWDMRCCLSGSWSMNSVELKNLEVYFQYRKEQGIQSRIYGAINLAGGKTISARVSYDGSLKEWVIQGWLEVQNGITAKDILDFAGSLAAPVSAPAFLDNVRLDSLSLEYHTKAKNCLMDLKGELSVGKAVSVEKIPLLPELLPKEFTYFDQGLSIRYEDKKIVSFTWTVEYSNHENKEEKKIAQNDVKQKAPAEKTSSEKEKQTEGADGESGGTVPEQDGVRWLDVQKQLGIASVKRVGIKCADGVVSALVEAGMFLGPVAVEVKELSVGYDFNQNRLTGGLRGLVLDYHTSVLAVTGGIYQASRMEEGVRAQFDGVVSVKAAKWQLQGLASYALFNNGGSSFFLFVRCQAALGGIPAFTVTGLMGGMGLERRLRLPGIAQVDQFPLLAMKEQKPMDVLDSLEGRNGKERWLSVSKGDYWAAAGIEFQSNELLYGKLLLTILFGHELTLALLGTAEMSLPKGAKPDKAFVYLKILLSAVMKPEEGSLTVDAALSEKSFLLHRDCRITGGAAFYLWFGKNTHAGDFVLTVGGYHPDFIIPSHYPQVPRAGIHWKISDCIDMKGEAYLAVTPSCAMAGGRLEFMFAKDALKAWFIAYADMVMQWHPFRFDAVMGVEIGVSLRLNLLVCHKTLKLTAGADLNLWGPEMGGLAKVHLSVISFEVSFGAAKESAGKALDWAGFSEILPQPEERHRITYEEGVQELPQKNLWLIKNQQFTIMAETAIPAGSLSIRPMNLSGVESSYSLKITDPNGGDRTSEFTVQEVHGNFPAALWGTPEKGSAKPDAKIVSGLVNGYQITAPAFSYNGQVIIEDYRESLLKRCRMDNPLGEAGEETKEFWADWQEDGVKALEQIASEDMKRSRLELWSQLQDIYSGPAGSFALTEKELQGLFADKPGVAGGNRE